MEKPSADAIFIAAATLAAEHNRQMSLAGSRQTAPRFDDMVKTFNEYVAQIGRIAEDR